MLRAYRPLVVAASIAVVVFSSSAAAQEERPPAKAKSDEASDVRFAVPKTKDVAELAAFIERIMKTRVSSRAEAVELQEKGLPAVQEAARKILEVEDDRDSKAYRLAKRIVLGADSQKIASGGDPAQQKAHLKEIVTFLADGALAAEDLELASSYAMSLEYGGDKAVAADAYAKFGELFERSRDEKLARYGRMMLGASRRLQLVGQPLVLKGTTVDGKPFDIESLRGKVVLVDFWATWCGPCLAEHPNIEKQYKKYKDKGFEVVGVSIDQDREALEDFVADKHTPWITLHDKENDGQHPAVVDYGIFGIPSMMLVDKEGKVVSTEARGAELARLLEDLLGEAE
jgi:thiol-disulfide isomerase/thioredoxin